MSLFEQNLLIAFVVIAGAVALAAIYALLSPKIPVSNILQLIVGYKAPPFLVSFVRRALTVLCSMAITWVANALGIVEEPENLLKVAGGAAAAIEWLGWGLFDQLKKSHQNDDNPPKHGGSGTDDVPGGLDPVSAGS